MGVLFFRARVKFWSVARFGHVFFGGAAERTVDAGWRIVEMEIVSEARKHSYSRNLNN